MRSEIGIMRSEIGIMRFLNEPLRFERTGICIFERTKTIPGCLGIVGFLFGN